MPILYRLMLAAGGAGLLASLPLSAARACDNDRFPCPVVVEAPAQEPAASTRSKRKKASQAAREEKARAKPERSAPRAADGPKESKPGGHGQAAASVPPQAVEAPPVMAASPLTDRWAGEHSPGGNGVATAAPDGSIGTETDAVVVRTSRVDGVAPEEAEANTVQLVDSKEINEIDRIAIEQESSWNVYLLMLLGAALAAASAVCLLPRLIRPSQEAAVPARASSDDPIGRAERWSRSASEHELSRQSTLRVPALIRAARTGAAYPRGRMAA